MICGEGCASVGRVGGARVLAGVVVVVVHHNGLLTNSGAVVHHAFALGAAAAGRAGTVADQNVGRQSQRIVLRIALHIHIGTWNDAAFHQGEAGPHVFLLQQMKRSHLRAIDADTGHLGLRHRRSSDTRTQYQGWKRHVTGLQNGCPHFSPLSARDFSWPEASGVVEVVAGFFEAKYSSSIQTPVLLFRAFSSSRKCSA